MRGPKHGGGFAVARERRILLREEEKFRFDRIDPLSEADRWDEIIRHQPQSSIFHSSAWARVLWETYGFRPFFFVVNREIGDASPAILTLAEVKSWITGRRGVSLPFADKCPMLARNEADFQLLWDWTLRLGQERKWRTVEIRGVPDSVPEASLEYYHHKLPLVTHATELFPAFDPSVRRAIRKAEKSGVAVTIERTEKAIRTYYQLHCLTRRKHGLPPQPLRFFLEIWKHIIAAGFGFIAIARHGERVLAAAVFFEFEKRALYKFGASDPLVDMLRPSNQVMWRGIADLCERGAVELDFGRTSLHNIGLRRYKIGWGCKEDRMRYTKWSFRKARLVEDTDRSESWQNVLFRRCPKALARICGQLLYPHVA